MPERYVEVHVRAGARERSVERRGDVIRVRTTAAPEKGRANDDVTALLADFLGVPRSSLTLVRGRTASRKLYKIAAP